MAALAIIMGQKGVPRRLIGCWSGENICILQRIYLSLQVYYFIRDGAKVVVCVIVTIVKKYEMNQKTR